jgi:hypothetical protein
VSRSASEPESASLHKLRVASLPEKRKPAIRREATFTSDAGTLRGERGDSAQGKFGSAGWESPAVGSGREARRGAAKT